MSKLPLEGTRILDFTIVWAGPWATVILGDLGAQIIRIDNIHFPDVNLRGMVRVPETALASAFTRAQYPDGDPGDRPWETTALHHYSNRNKLSATFDLFRPKGREYFHRLVAISDVIIDNNASGTLEKLGVTYEAMRDINPRLIMCQFPGYGMSGPYKPFKGYGANVEAVLGHNSLRGYPDLDPTTTYPVFQADAAAGASAAFMIMAALHYRDRTGKGQYIDMSQAENVTHHLSQAVMDYSMNRRVQGSLGNRDPSMAPQGAYRCAGDDNWIALSIEDDAQFAALCQALGQPDLAQDDRFADVVGRHHNQDTLDEIIAQWVADKDNQALMAQLQGLGVPAMAVFKQTEILENPHLVARGFFEEVTHPIIGTRRLPGPVFDMDKTPIRIRRPAPLLGEHNDFVYKELLGVSDAEYEELLREDYLGDIYVAARQTVKP